ncbi:MAG: molybdate ABC transporter substrate-binding protein [Candidatus Dormibacteria bacterium]
MPKRFVAAIAFLLAGCGGPGPAAPALAPTPVPAGRAATLTVLVAASLGAAFQQIDGAFEAANPGVHVTASPAASSTLAAQLEQGAPADVFASADVSTMERVRSRGLLGEPARIFARNRLEIVVRPGNPHHLGGLVDLSRPGLSVALCQPSVPCGRYAAGALAKAGVNVPASSQEIDVTSVLGRVELGEADAGVVYRTDVMAAGGRVTGIPIPDSQNVLAEYPIATIRGGHQALARVFVEFVLGPQGRAVLARRGFLA